MNMIQKKFIVLFTSLVLLSTLVISCNTVSGVFGFNAKKESKIATKIDKVEYTSNMLTQQKMDNVSFFACGVQYSLNKITNPEPTIVVAKDLNNRIVSIAGTPTLNEAKVVWTMVDGLIASNKVGATLLQQKDKEIEKIQQNEKINDEKKQQLIDQYREQAKVTAMKADGLQNQLDDYRGLFGLKAVFKGLKQLLTTSIWVTIGVIIIYLVLRVVSVLNPAVGGILSVITTLLKSIFAIFEQIFSYVINIIKVAFPKAISYAGLISSNLFTKSEDLLTKIIDNIQTLKEYEKKTGNPITMKELFTELDKSLDSDQKDKISQIKKDLGY